MALEARDVDRVPGIGWRGTDPRHPSVATHVFDASLRACEILRAAGGKVCSHIDYRPVFGGLTRRDAGENRFVAHEAVTARLQEVLRCAT